MKVFWLKMMNIGMTDVNYFWNLVEDNLTEETPKNKLSMIRGPPKKARQFDISPISGVIKPKESENVKVTFYALPFSRA